MEDKALMEGESRDGGSPSPPTMENPGKSWCTLGEPISHFSHFNKESIFAGDINCNLLNCEDNDTKHMKRIYNTPGYKQLVENPTRTTTDTMTLTLFDMGGGGGMMAPKIVFDHCAQTLRRRKLKLSDF